MVGAHFHDVELVVDASVSSVLSSAHLVLSNFPVATSGDETGEKSHVLGLFHVVFTEASILVTEGLSFSIGVPVIMGLIVSVILVEGIVEVSINPRELGHMTEEIRHLRVFIGFVVVSCTDGVQQGLVKVAVNNLVTEIVVTLLPIIFGEVR